MNREEQIIKASQLYPKHQQKVFVDGVLWGDRNPQNHWHDAQGDDLPEIDREVIVLLDNGKVCFAHRPVKSYITVSVINHREAEEYYPKHYDKGGWNIPNVKWWLVVAIPAEEGGEE